MVTVEDSPILTATGLAVITADGAIVSKITVEVSPRFDPPGIVVTSGLVASSVAVPAPIASTVSGFSLSPA